jgi:tryptophanyl-tRNA synthetase
MSAQKTTSARPVLFSGMQPTGHGLMLGNFIGAMKNWVRLQDTHQCIYCVVDLHAITIKQEPEKLRNTSYELLASYIACGIDPKKSSIFMQSQVPEHAELAWILTCHTYMGELNRMTQFKDKSVKEKSIPSGLFTYPSLMAADILLHQADLVPVGSDQKQHIELARDLANRMNHFYGELFKVPEPYIPPVGARIMSLQDPAAKMSKSTEDAMATVFLTDTEDVILKKFKRAVTDSLNKINYSDEQPGLKNLIDIQSALSGKPQVEITASYEGKVTDTLSRILPIW